MKHKILKSLLLSVIILLSSFSSAEENPYAKLDWKSGPTTKSIGGRSSIFVPKDYVFLSVKETDKYSIITKNQPTGVENFFGPNNSSWEAYFSFDSTGYVKDDDEIDADELLETIKSGEKSANKYRKEQGWATLTTLGWEFMPRYDKNNNLLEWAFIVQNNNNQKKIINYKTRILGRAGVMSVVLVVDPEGLHEAVSDFKDKIQGFKYNNGEKYSEYREGDRVAEFGLAALIAGGAAAVASKKGVWAAIVGFLIAAKKLVFVAALGLFAWIISLFRRK